MRLLSLLFDPRGAIDRRAFWSGFLQLTLVSAVVCVGLGHVGADHAFIILPVIGEAFAVADLAGRVQASGAWGAPLAVTLLVAAARLYATVCLCLKRLRDAGHGPAPLIAIGAWSLVVHVSVAAWTQELWGQGMAVILPLYADVALTAVAWTIFLIWLGAVGRPRALAWGRLSSGRLPS